MNVTIHHWGVVTVDVYQLTKGERLPRHKHPWDHTHGVARGATKVTLWWESGENTSYFMKAGELDFIFTDNVEHEIEALEEDTIIVNMRTAGLPGQAGADGGITFDDS